MTKRMSVLVAVMLLALGITAGPAAAHHLEVDPPGGDHTVDVWIGGPPWILLPDQAQGEGLFPGPPFAPESRQPAAHGKGLVAACEATASNDVVTIIGPGPTACVHG